MVNRYSYAAEASTRVHHQGKRVIDLPYDRYFVWVPQLATCTEFDLTIYGTPMTGTQRELHAPDLNQMILVKWSISEMLNAFILGHRLVLEHKTDAVKIHNHIEEYFDMVNDIIDKGEIERYDIDLRLQELDNFNRSIYNFNKGSIKANREEIIKKASLLDIMPGLIFQEVVDIKAPPKNVSAKDTSKGISKYTPLSTTQETTDNSLTPVYSQVPELNYTLLDYTPRYQDPMERRLAKEFDKAKRILENKE